MMRCSSPFLKLPVLLLASTVFAAAPLPVTDLQIQMTDSVHFQLNWLPVTQDTAGNPLPCVVYNVYLGQSPNFEFSATTWVDSTSATTYLHFNENDSGFYRVKAQPCGDIDPIIADNVVVVDTTNVDILSVNADQIVLFATNPDSFAIAEDDILVGTSEQPFLRRATQISQNGDLFTVNTAGVAIVEAVQQGILHESYQIGDSLNGLMGMQINYLAPGVGLLREGRGISLDGVILFDGQAGGVALNVSLPTGAIDFIPNVELDWEIRNWQLREFQFIASGDLQFDCDVRVQANGELTHDTEILLASYTKRQVFTIGLLPVLMKTTLEFHAGYLLEIESEAVVQTGIESQNQISIGAIYSSNIGWTPVYDRNNTSIERELEWSLDGTMKLQGYIKPSVRVEFYELAGPDLNVQPYFRFQGTQRIPGLESWNAYCGVQGNLGFSVAMLDDLVPDYNWEFPVWERWLAGDMVLVPAGHFIMGQDSVATPEHSVTLTHDFLLGRTEVTNQHYLEALNWANTQGLVSIVGDYVQQYGVNLLWLEGNTDLHEIKYNPEEQQFYLHAGTGVEYGPGNDHGPGFAFPSGYDPAIHPVKHLTWYGAACFCDWLSQMEDIPTYYNGNWNQIPNPDNPYLVTGFRLPTEAEWEFAAQYDDERIYPWGSAAITCTLANYIYDCDYWGGFVYSFCVGWTNPVGTHSTGASYLGLQDMVGNLSEYTNDSYGPYSLDPQIDPMGPDIGTYGNYRVIKGGGWHSCEFVYQMNSAYRSYLNPWDFRSSIGFRLCRTIL